MLDWVSVSTEELARLLLSPVFLSALMVFSVFFSGGLLWGR